MDETIKSYVNRPGMIQKRKFEEILRLELFLMIRLYNPQVTSGLSKIISMKF